MGLDRFVTRLSMSAKGRSEVRLVEFRIGRGLEGLLEHGYRRAGGFLVTAMNVTVSMCRHCAIPSLTLISQGY